MTGRAGALVAYVIFAVRPLISYLHEVGDGLGLHATKRFPELDPIDSSGERVYGVVFRYLLRCVAEQSPPLNVLAQRLVFPLL